MALALIFVYSPHGDAMARLQQEPRSGSPEISLISAIRDHLARRSLFDFIQAWPALAPVKERRVIDLCAVRPAF